MKRPPGERYWIGFSDGFWWFHDAERRDPVRLDPLFEECGWSVGALCELLGVGRRTFARVVEEKLGITGKAWLCTLRAVSACHLLREGGKIEPLAHRLGFADKSNFTREFKRQVGVSPSCYRRAEWSRSQRPGPDD